MSKAPLSDVIVLDLSRVLAGPYATMLLNDLGAEVIKVERPGVGDDSRNFGPFMNKKSAYFISLNREKKSIVLDLKEEKDLNYFKELVKKVDVLVENFRPGTMQKLGIGYETLKQINPQLIYAAISGFGHTGPNSKKPAYDLIVQAAGGIMSITGEPDGPPIRIGASIGDITAALFAVIGINSALYERKKSGDGQKVDISMLDSQIAILENAIIRYLADGEPPKPLGSRHPSITPFEAFKAKDDWIVIAAGNDALWQKLCEALEKKDLLDREEFDTNKKRTLNHAELHQILAKEIKKYKAKELILLLEEYGIPSGPINSVDNLFEDPQVQERNMLVNVKDEKIGNIKIAGNPIKMSNLEDRRYRESAPEIGEDTEEILKKYLDLR